MKKFLVPLLAFLAVTLFAFHFHSAAAGVSLAMFIPLMPKGGFLGQRLLNRMPLDNDAMNLNAGTWGLGGEDLDYPVYDRLLMANANGTAAQTLFNTPVGQVRNSAQLTYADTNIEAANVPNSQKFAFKKLYVMYTAAAVRDQAGMQLILNWMRTTTIRFNIDSKADMFRLPLWRFWGPMQVVVAPAATINTVVSEPFWSAIWEINVPLVLQALTIFKLVIEPQAASNAALDGDYLCFAFDSGRLRKN